MQAKFPVYGKTMFHEKSAICRAAVYSDAINDLEGGEVFVQMNKGWSETITYDAGFDNGVEVFELKTVAPTDRSFVITKVVYKCPIEDYPKDDDAFL